MIRDLEKQVRTLTKELQYYKKRSHIFENPEKDEEIINDSEDTMIDLKRKIICEECGKGTYVEFEIMDKCYGTCNVCEHRKRIK